MQTMPSMMCLAKRHSSHWAGLGFTLLEILVVLVIVGILGSIGMIHLAGNIRGVSFERDKLIACHLAARGQAMVEGGGICLRMERNLMLYRIAAMSASGEIQELLCPGLPPGYSIPPEITIESVPETLCYDTMGKVCAEEWLSPDEMPFGLVRCSGQADTSEASITLRNHSESASLSINKETGWIE